METLNWGGFKAQLLQHPDKHLQFQYAADKLVNAAYHITEIKQAPITSVDCGGVMNKWTEVIIQLWEPQDQQQERAMTVGKALGIINLVEKSLPLQADAVVKIEFGNAQFDTRQLFPGELTGDGDNLVVNLQPDFVQCKAINRGGNCGTPATDEKPKRQLINLAAETNACTPGGGCC